MDPLTGLITGGASLLGSMFTSMTNASNTQAQLAGQEMMLGQTEQFNAGQADLNRQFQASQVAQQEGFQQQMSNTAYQRAAADAKAAGLNPMMMFGSGGPASVPSGGAASGSTASVGTPTVPMPSKTNPLGDLGKNVQNAIGAMVDAKSIDLMTQRIANLETERDIASKQAPLTRGLTTSDIGLKESVTRGNIADLPGRQLAGDDAKRVMDSLPSWLRTTAADTDYLGKRGAGAVDDIWKLVSSAGGLKRLQPSPDNRPVGYTESTSKHGDTTFKERSYDYFDRQ